MMKQLLRPDEVADILNVTTRQVYKLINDIDNPIPSIKIGGVIRVRTESLNKWLKKCKNDILYK